MKVICPQCQTQVTRLDQRFCDQCGFDLSAHYESLGIKVSASLGSSEVTQSVPPPRSTELVPPAPALKATLHVHLPSGETIAFELVSPVTKLGKGLNNDLVLDDPTVSTSHASIEADREGFILTDLGSRNGTFINDERLAAPRPLRDGDLVKLGRSTLRFHLHQEREPSDTTIQAVNLQTAQIDESLIAKFSPRLARKHQVFPVAETQTHLIIALADPTNQDAIEEVKREAHKEVEVRLASASDIAERIDQHYGPKLIGVLRSGEKIEYRLNKPEVDIGKAPHNDIVLDHPAVSHTHAVILARDGGYIIVDLESRNGTFVNGQRLGSEGQALRHGDKIQMGEVLLTFRSPAETPENTTVMLSVEALEAARQRVEFKGQSARANQASAVASPKVAVQSVTPLTTPSVAAPKPVVEAEEEEEKGGKKKKKKKKKGKDDDRIKAALVNSLSRILATVLGAVLTVVLTVLILRQTTAPTNPGSSSVSNVAGNPKPKFTSTGEAHAIQGGKFEASGVIQISGTDAVLFVDDSKPGQVFRMQLDSSGNQRGAIQPLPLGVKVINPEAITYGGGYYYVVGSQADPAAGEQNSLARFALDATGSQLQGPVEVVAYLSRFLLANVPELKGEGEKSGALGGLNIEGMAWDPVRERLLLGLRSPFKDGQALVISLKLADPRKPLASDNLQLAEPQAMPLALGGHGIRDIHYDSRLRSFLIISGATETAARTDFKLWEWSGTSDTQPREELALDRRVKPEGITRMEVAGRDFIFIVCDASSILKLDYATTQ
jgi:pSer/pThr/pTyr-binding forkhead associated (FHA) protein